MGKIEISIENKDAFDIQADVMLLKYAQAAYGLDREVIRRLNEKGALIDPRLPKISGYFQTGSLGVTKTKDIMFVGVAKLRNFEYAEIREFGKKALASLASALPSVKSIITTVHGVGYGLDEYEAFKSLIAGMIDAIRNDDFPDKLKEIIFTETAKGRYNRLNNSLNELFPDGTIDTSQLYDDSILLKKASDITLKDAGVDFQNKKRVFVAMPFASDFNDLYEYGIQGAVKSIGYLCERADLATYTGDVMEWVKGRIATADFIVADLTDANANVYLEVGYAWGKERETILIVKDTNQLTFDTMGQKCIAYNSIKDLENKLSVELKNLLGNNQIK